MAKMVLCGTPEKECSGKMVQMSKGWRGSSRAHSTHEQAFNCYARFLRSVGYMQISGRDFRPPGGGPVEVLTKKSRFGGTVRRGKRENKNAYLPKRTSGSIW